MSLKILQLLITLVSLIASVILLLMGNTTRLEAMTAGVALLSAILIQACQFKFKRTARVITMPFLYLGLPIFSIVGIFLQSDQLTAYDFARFEKSLEFTGYIFGFIAVFTIPNWRSFMFRHLPVYLIFACSLELMIARRKIEIKRKTEDLEACNPFLSDLFAIFYRLAMTSVAFFMRTIYMRIQYALFELNMQHDSLF